jgi:hypothetical protein
MVYYGLMELGVSLFVCISVEAPKFVKPNMIH